MSFRAPFLALFCGLAVALTPVAASAGTWRHADASGDIMRGYDSYEPAPAETFGDIRNWKVEHTATRVIVRVHARDLRRDPMAEFTVAVKTPNHEYASLGSLGRADQGYLNDATVGVPVDCAGYRWRVDFATNDLVTSFPRSCIGRPSWIRVQVIFRHGVHDAQNFYIDWDYGTGRKGALFVPYGPRVYAG